MRVTLVSPTFQRGMGYMNTMLPKYLVKCGAEVHFVTSDLPHYHYSSTSPQSYVGFDGAAPAPAGSSYSIDGYTVHTLKSQLVAGQPRIQGLSQKLAELRPQAVQIFGCNGWLPLEAALCRSALSFRLFTSAHTTRSVFRLARTSHPFLHLEYFGNFIGRRIPGAIVHRVVDCCIAATDDCADVARRFFGVPSSKLRVIPLGVDTEIFFPVGGELAVSRRQELRSLLGVSDDDCLAIYTGQFTEAKNPFLLSEAVANMRANGQRIMGLFIGGGEQRARISESDGSITLPFKPVAELGDYYRAADIGVWPTQESTSMLDASACGLPIIVNHTLVARERINGNGLTYELNNLESLIEQLTALLDPRRRLSLGNNGAQRIRTDFSWQRMAELRLALYDEAARMADRSP